MNTEATVAAVISPDVIWEPGGDPSPSREPLPRPSDRRGSPAMRPGGRIRPAWSWPCSAVQPALVALAAQVARRAQAASIAPGVAMLAVAEVAGMRVLDDELQQRLAAEAIGHVPCSGLVEPHERRVDRHRLVETEADGDLQRLQRVVAAVGIAGVVGLAHAADH